MNVALAAQSKGIVPYRSLWSEMGPLAESFAHAEPYRHVVLENFLDEKWIRGAAADFPAADTGAWIHYFHVNERKLGRNKLSLMPPRLRETILELNSSPFIAFLEALTGIRGLLPDPSLEGGGLHQTSRGGFLNIHTDFSVHPHRRNWLRRVNLILYLNDDWRDEYGGHLEMWDRDVKRCVQKISPALNRAGILAPPGGSAGAAFHGHPEPLACPDGVTRKSIALYYFPDELAPRVEATDYRARPGDPLAKRLGIFADKLALTLYDRLKR